jgi:ribosomal protein L24E
MTTKECRYCGEDIERQPGVGWVCVEIDGTYDICEGNWKDRIEEFGGHQPVKVVSQ